MLGTMRLALFMFLTPYLRMNDLQAAYFNLKDKYESILLYSLNMVNRNIILSHITRMVLNTG